MIWPVSDCDEAVEVIVISDYHRNNPRGYIAAQTTAYSARWEHHRPGIVCVRPADGSGGADWIEWSLGGELHDVDGGSVLGAATGDWSPDTLLKGSQAYRGEQVAVEWIQPHERGEFRARLLFTQNAIRCSLTFTSATSTRYRRAVVGAGTRVWADESFDYNPDTSGTFRRPLHALRPTGAKWLTPAPFALGFRQPNGAWVIAAIECPRDQLTFCGFGGRGGQDGTLDFELDYLWAFYHAVATAARRARPDALLDFQCAHPQFAEFHNMTRLNDFFLPQTQALRVMENRARIAKIASFGALIDTDCPAGLAYLRGSSRFGNQSLYLTHAQLADPAVVAAVRDAQTTSRSAL